MNYAERKAARAANPASSISTGNVNSNRITELAAAMIAANTKSDFALSLMQQYKTRGSLSDKQWAWVEKLTRQFSDTAAMLGSPEALAAKVEARQVDLSGLHGCMHRARERGLKWPKLRLVTADGSRVVLSLAGASAKFPGSVNVTDGRPYGENTWFGRIVEGKFAPAGNCPPEVAELLVEVNKDPEAGLKVQGLKTGTCSCCQRELTNALSIELGIGPVCRERFF
jgi:hypothetical protein